MNIGANRKIDNILDRLEKSSNLSRDGRNWLIAAVDPFHDSDIALAGYPDVLTAATVVQLVKQQVQIAVPTGGNGIVTNGSNWDCSIALCPNLVASTVGTNFSVGNTGVAGTGAGANGSYWGGLVYNSGPSGSSLWPDNSNLGATTTTGNYLSPASYVKGQGRVIGMGFEVVNTTSQLNKQGQCTAWRIPSEWTPTNLYVNDTAFPVVDGTGVYNLGHFPPSTIASAQLLFGSRSWAASEGAYVVSRQNSTHNPALLPSFQNIAFTATDMQSRSTDTWFATATPLVAPAVYADWYTPFDVSGVHFTGLSYTTTLTVNVRWLIERIPGPQETDLVVLATPSASYDSLALELYTRCMGDMPPGVMLSENPLGEWFRSALSKVADWAPRIGGALSNFVPGAAIIGDGLGMAAGAAKKLIPKKEKKSKQSQKVPLTGSASTTRLLMPK